ncbi:MAG: aspartate--tRNA ligase [Gemmatimonadota bacterium]
MTEGAGVTRAMEGQAKPQLRSAFRAMGCGEVRGIHRGQELRLAGWVHRRRDLGGVYFLDLRDRTGLLQLSVGPDWTEPQSLEVVKGLGAEDVIQVKGQVVARPPDARNAELATGEVELQVESVLLLNEADTPAIPVYRSPGEPLPAEELRLRHRHLDLRRPELLGNLQLRHSLVLAARNVMDRLGFLEVETPILTKATPEGARDYLVPSRVHPGEFYALPQSPQLYKQLLVIAGVERYFQIARCFRDEDLRADRQPEFTQIDVEASFIDSDDLFLWMEELMASLGEVAGIPTPTPFPRLTYAEAMERFGVDRPDSRVGLEIQDFTSHFRKSESTILRKAVEEGGRARGIRVPGGGVLSRKQIEALEAEAKAAGAPGLFWAKRAEDGAASGPLSKFLTPGVQEAIGMGPGDLLLLAAGPDSVTSPALAVVRVAAAATAELPPTDASGWLWVTDFPLFLDDGNGSLVPGHHPFVLPHPEDVGRLDGEPLAVRSLAYDLVYNGAELGSGSIRIHDAELQRRVLRRLGLGDEEIQQKFGFLLEALASGAPPHGGIALGVDRIVKMFLGAGSLRDVIAFPKTTAARALFEGAPSPVGEHELTELGVQIMPPAER